MTTKRETWDQLDTETDEEYKIFRLSLDNPDWSSTQLSKAYNNLKTGTTYSANQITALAKINRFQERQQAYNSGLNKIVNYVSDRGEIEALIDFQKRQKKLAARLNEIATELLSKAAAALSAIDPADITVNTITKFIDSSIKVAELGFSSEAQSLMLTDLIAVLDRNDDDKLNVTVTGTGADSDLTLFEDAVDDYDRISKEYQQSQRFEYDKEAGLD